MQLYMAAQQLVQQASRPCLKHGLSEGQHAMLQFEDIHPAGTWLTRWMV